VRAQTAWSVMVPKKDILELTAVRLLEEQPPEAVRVAGRVSLLPLLDAGSVHEMAHISDGYAGAGFKKEFQHIGVEVETRFTASSGTTLPNETETLPETITMPEGWAQSHRDR